MCNRKRALNLFHCRMQLTNVISSYNFYFERKTSEINYIVKIFLCS